MTTYQVKLVDGSHRVIGLKYEPKRTEDEDRDVLLIFRYLGGDVDTCMRDADMMLGALYDLFQCDDRLKDGDRFETEFGAFICRGVHVVKE